MLDIILYNLSSDCCCLMHKNNDIIISFMMWLKDDDLNSPILEIAAAYNKFLFCFMLALLGELVLVYNMVTSLSILFENLHLYV